MPSTSDLRRLSLPASALTIGSFDGLHLGHQALIRSVVDQGRREGMASVVVTFYPHPSVVLRGRRPSFYITLPDDKADLLQAMGVDQVVTLTFDEDLSQVTAGAFLDRLTAHLGFRHLWIGEDFALGHEREGNRLFLRKQAAARGFQLHEMEPVLVGGEVVSSTRVREALRSGDVARVATYLGRPFRLAGTVGRGAARGKSLGIPTANLELHPEQAYPGTGVYACRARVGDRWRAAVTNVGLRPTFADDLPAPVVEAHVLDWEGELYDRRMPLEFIARLRNEQRFESVDQLVAQIRRDIDQTRQLLGRTMEDALVD